MHPILKCPARRVGAAVALLLLSHCAFAQTVAPVKPSVEGAMTFLSALAQKRWVRIAELDNGKWTYTTDIYSIKPVSRCVVDVEYFSWLTTGSRTTRIDWSRVGEVQKPDSDNWVVVKTGGTSLSFGFVTRELGARGAYAMEYLRFHCDAAPNVGF